MNGVGAWAELINALSLFVISAGGFYAFAFVLPKIASMVETWIVKADLPKWINTVVEIAKPFVKAEYENTLKDVKKAYEDKVITVEEWKEVAANGKKRVVSHLIDALNVGNVPASLKPFLEGKLGEFVEAALAEVRSEAKKKLLGNGPSVMILPTTPSPREDIPNSVRDAQAIE